MVTTRATLDDACKLIRKYFGDTFETQAKKFASEHVGLGALFGDGTTLCSRGTNLCPILSLVVIAANHALTVATYTDEGLPTVVITVKQWDAKTSPESWQRTVEETKQYIGMSCILRVFLL
jgi:hypothetical protein